MHRCESCELARAKKRNPKVVQQAVKEKKDILSWNKYMPGDFVSMDQFSVSTPGRRTDEALVRIIAPLLFYILLRHLLILRPRQLASSSLLLPLLFFVCLLDCLKAFCRASAAWALAKLLHGRRRDISPLATSLPTSGNVASLSVA